MYVCINPNHMYNKQKYLFMSTIFAWTPYMSCCLRKVAFGNGVPFVGNEMVSSVQPVHYEVGNMTRSMHHHIFYNTAFLLCAHTWLQCAA
jgi:hypothetical protein